MNVLISGVNGFIGQKVVESLVGIKDIKLYGIGRNDNYIGESEITYFKGDITDLSSFQQIIDKMQCCDVIIHLAANINMAFEQQEIIKVNCNGTHNICLLSQKLSCEKIIYMSSIPVIGKPIQMPITEEHPLQPESLYHISKLAGEQIVKLNELYGVDSIILRIPSPIGIGMNPNRILPIFINNALQGNDIVLFGNGMRRQNYIDIRDICQAIIKAIKCDVEGIFNIAAISSYTNFQLAQTCVDVTHSSSSIYFNGKEDPQEEYNWDISINKSIEKLGFYPKYELAETINWMLTKF